MTQLSQHRVAAPSHSDPDGRWQPPSRSAGSRGRRFLAAAALVGLVVGVPFSLSFSIGWPLPRSLPGLSEVQGILSDPLEGSLIVKALALVAWLAWAHFTLCVVAELAAAVRARRSGRARDPIRVPLGGPSQQFARRLVEAALLTATIATSVTAFSGTMLTPARPAVASQELDSARPVAHAAHSSPTPRPVPATVPATAAPAPVPPPEYVVQPPRGGYYDSLWDIAERFLGDGQRWREIYELNRDREQPDGRTLTRPELIRPGWCLRLPPDATGLPASRPADAPVPGWVPSAPTDLSPVTGSAPSPSPSPSSAAAVPALPARPTHPAAPSSTPSKDRPPPGVSPGSEPAPADHALPRPVRDDQQDDGRRGSVQAVGGLLAAAALTGLATLRHRQRRRRAAGQAVPRPDTDLLQAEGQLRVLAEPNDMTRVDEALRALTLAVAEYETLPDVRLAFVREGHVDLLPSDARTDAPQPFVALDEGLVWRAPAAAQPLLSPEQASRALPLLPLLLTVGHGSEGPVMLDVEAVGCLAVRGPDNEVTEVLSHLVAEAALAPWADGVEVLLVGFDVELAGSLQQLAPDRLTALDHLDHPMLHALNTRASRVAAAGDRLAARVEASGPGTQTEVRPPLLVVCAVTPEEPILLAPDEGRGGCVLVAPGPWNESRATWVLDGPLPVPGHAPRPVPCRLDRKRMHALAESLRIARMREPVQATTAEADPARSQQEQGEGSVAVSPPAGPGQRPPVVRPLREGSAPGGREKSANEDDELDDAVAAYLEGKAPATVGLLGPITVGAAGNVEPDRRTRLTEIVAYLAVHRRGAAVSDFDAAIWPDRAVSLKTRNQAITRARAWLGGDGEGLSWLRPMTDGALRLSRQVLVDWELFQALEKRSQEHGRLPTAVRRDLETAMRLVRGKPLSHLPTGRYGWLAETFLEQEIPSAVVDVAHRLARLLLEDGDAEAVLEVARLALEVDRYDERPWRDLLEAHALRSEHRQVDLLVRQLRELLEVELDDDLQPETAELIERLLPQRRRA
jgi:DNA-binding SARP family transcriptional activator